MPIRCEIVSQDRTVFQGDADVVMLPGAAGEMGILQHHAPVLTTLKYGMGILQHHAPVLTTLKYGVVRVRQKGVERIFAVAGGVAEVGPDLVTVLADAAENVEEIDVKRAQFAKKRAEEALAKGPTLEPDTLLRIEAALRRSNLRLDVVRRFRKSESRFTEQ